MRTASAHKTCLLNLENYLMKYHYWIDIENKKSKWELALWAYTERKEGDFFPSVPYFWENVNSYKLPYNGIIKLDYFI